MREIPMMQIINTTDGQYVGMIFDPKLPLILNGIVFTIESEQEIDKKTVVFSNSNYVITAEEI